MCSFYKAPDSDEIFLQGRNEPINPYLLKELWVNRVMRDEVTHQPDKETWRAEHTGAGSGNKTKNVSRSKK